MNTRILRNLGIVLFALLMILVALELGDDSAPAAGGSPLFAELKENINAIERIEIERAGEDTVVLENTGDGWSVPARDGFPADIAKIRALLIALADARVLEEKTADPARYGAIGVDDPDGGESRGVRITAAGGGHAYAVVIGDANQGSNRYVRIADQTQSLLVDQNPDLPDDAGGWLDTDLVDVGMTEIKAVTISHADGETIRIEKADAESSGFEVLDIPAGRELSYATVANSVAGALGALGFEDVRAAVDEAPSTVAEFTTFDEREFAVDVFAGEEDGETWIAVRGDSLDAHLTGRQFRIESYKANQLTRRWEDLLKPEDE